MRERGMLGEGGKVYKRVKEGRGLDNRHIIRVIHGTLKIEKTPIVFVCASKIVSILYPKQSSYAPT